jgi:hypothetical protein
VLNDTTAQNGKTYFKVAAESRFNPSGYDNNPKLEYPFYLRADENYVYYYDLSVAAEVPLLNLQEGSHADDTVYFGSSREISYNAWISEVKQDTIFGLDLTTLDYFLFELDTSEFVDSDIYRLGVSSQLGFTYFGQTYWLIDSSIAVSDSALIYTKYGFRYKLNSCVINGVTYSNQIGVEQEDEPNSPQSFTLSQNYPNPFNPTTTIEFAVPKAAHVKLAVYDILGREVSVLANDYYATGNYKVTFNGPGLPSGVYFYNLQADGFTQTRKFVLLK